MANNSIGFIETYGLAACIAAADAAVKSANVTLIGYEYAKGDGLCTVKVEGNVGACKAAIIAGKRAAEAVRGTHQGTKSTLLKARPADGIMDTMVKHRENVGGEQALAEGYRPKGESRMPVLVKSWKPQEEAVVEEPITEAPVPSEVEDLKDEEAEESSDSDEDDSQEKEEIIEKAPETEEAEVVEEIEVTEDAKVTEESEVSVEAVTEEDPVAEETEKVEAPKSEESDEVVAPEAEAEVAEESDVTETAEATETPVVEEEPVVEETETIAEDPVTEEMEAEVPAEIPEVTKDPAPAEKPKKSTTGTRRGGRSRKKKTDKK